MEELQVPTHRLEVEVHAATGDALTGSMFAAELPYVTSGWESLLAILNDEREFLPCFGNAPGTERTILNKTHIVRVRLTPGADGAAPPWIDEAQGESCALQLVDGTRLTGELHLDTRLEESRLIDKLNQADRFVVFIADGDMHFVQACRVVRAESFPGDAEE